MDVVDAPVRYTGAICEGAIDGLSYVGVSTGERCEWNVPISTLESVIAVANRSPLPNELGMAGFTIGITIVISFVFDRVLGSRGRRIGSPLKRTTRIVGYVLPLLVVGGIYGGFRGKALVEAIKHTPPFPDSTLKTSVGEHLALAHDPIIAEADGTWVMVATLRRSRYRHSIIVAWDLATSKILWERPETTWLSNPLQLEVRSGRAVIADGLGRVETRDLVTGRVLGESTLPQRALRFGIGQKTGEILYEGDRRYAIDPSTGQATWSVDNVGSRKRRSCEASAPKVEAKGLTRWRSACVDHGILAGLAADSSSSDAKMFAVVGLDAESGAEKWRHPITPGQSNWALQTENTIVALESVDGADRLVARDHFTGETRWTKEPPTDLGWSGSAAAAGPYLAITMTDERRFPNRSDSPSWRRPEEWVEVVRAEDGSVVGSFPPGR